jgi:beta-lactam-binding protein with PASTA domain
VNQRLDEVDDHYAGSAYRTPNDAGEKWRKRLRTLAPYLVSAVAGFALAYLIVAVFIFPSTSVASDLSVPNVTGLAFDDATAKLHDAGFKVSRGERRYDATAPAGQVLGQTPIPGTTEPKGATVVLDVSRGQRSVEVPRVVGLTREQAIAAIENAGLEVGEVSQVENAAPRGQVLLSSPVGGAKAPTPSSVNLTVSDGPATLTVPDLIGQDYGQARSLLSQLGFEVGNVTYEANPAFRDNTIIGQTPAANSSAPAGTTIQLTVAGQP